MEDCVFIYDGEYESLVKEKYLTPSTVNINLFVWRAKNGSLGFNSNLTAINFTKRFLADKSTLLFPVIQLLNNMDIVGDNIHNLKGITFLNHKELLIDVYNEFVKCENQKKKNSLLQRYGKAITEVSEPEVLRWFNNGLYTSNFLNFCSLHDIRFLTWIRQDAGIAFFSFDSKTNEIKEEVRNLLSVDGVNLIVVHSLSSLPSF